MAASPRPSNFRVTGKPIHLLLLESALKYWRRTAEKDLRDKLQEYRSHGTTMSVGTTFYNVLHSERIVSNA